MKRDLLHALFITVLIVAAFSSAADAQFSDSMGANWSQPLQAYASTAIWSSIFYRTYPKGSKNSAAAPPAKTVRPAQKDNVVNEAAMRFRSTGTSLKARDLADLIGGSPAERDQYFKLMNVVLTAFDSQAAKAGKPHDIPLALSYFLAENSRIYHGRPELSDDAFMQIRNAIARSLSTSGAVGNLSDRQKQEMYETLVIYTGLTQYGYEEGVKAGTKQIAEGYQKLAGINLQTVTKMSPDEIDIGAIGQ
jgi:hypothetical protein